MQKTTKGALAAGAAVVLLLGGAGTLAYWTDEAPVDGGTISSGSIDLVAADCSTSAWLHAEDDSTVTNLVPGDSIYKVCAATLELVGDHIAATVGITDASVTSVTNALGDEVTASATIPTGAVTGEGSHDVSVRIQVDFPYEAATNDSQEGVATLDQLELTAVQTHTPEPAPAP